MNMTNIKVGFCLVLMIGFLLMAFVTKDVINSNLFASLGIIAGSFAFSHQSENRRVEE